MRECSGAEYFRLRKGGEAAVWKRKQAIMPKADGGMRPTQGIKEGGQRKSRGQKMRWQDEARRGRHGCRVVFVVARGPALATLVSDEMP